MTATRANPFNSELRVCVPRTLNDLVDVAADKQATTRSAYVRQAVVDRLRTDGLDHGAPRQAACG